MAGIRDNLMVHTDMQQRIDYYRMVVVHSQLKYMRWHLKLSALGIGKNTPLKVER